MSFIIDHFIAVVLSSVQKIGMPPSASQALAQNIVMSAMLDVS